MKALTLYRPWPWAICYARKDVENRRWAPPKSLHGQRFAIHAGRTFLAGECFAIETRFGKRPPPEAEQPAGVIVATVRLVDVTDRSRSKWAFVGSMHWRLADVRVLATPVKCRGAQGLWTVPEDVEQLVLAQERAA